MLTPFNVMLGIWPPGENWPFTLVGLSASFSSPSPRSLTPRGSLSGRTSPELSHRSDWAGLYPQLLFSSAQVPTPLPGRPPSPAFGGPLPLDCAQPWPVPTDCEAWLSASNSAESACA